MMNLKSYLVGLAAWLALLVTASPSEVSSHEPEKSFPKFVSRIVEDNFGIGYGVTTADINSDGKLDIVAINPTQVVWFENPTWKRNVAVDGATGKDNVCLAVHDIDGDGRLDIALGADWNPTNTETGGTLQWLRHPRSAEERWQVFQIGSEPTLHRIQWADCDGDGKKELIVAPLQGRGTKPPLWEKGNGVRLKSLRVPSRPEEDAWKEEVIDATLHSLHNLAIANFDSDPQDEILTASLEGIFLFDRNPSGEWLKMRIGEGNDEENGLTGAGEIKIGRFKSGKKYIATVEPWHGHQVVVYLPPNEKDALWERKVLDTELKQGHALWCADLDQDGEDELVVGWRESGKSRNYGIAVYDPVDENWNAGHRHVVDDGSMATEDLTVADLNGDGFPDIVAAGRASHNIKIYWNQGKKTD